MLDFVKQLFENSVISEETKSEIEAAWEQRIQENRESVKEELREEIAVAVREEMTPVLREEVSTELRQEFSEKYEYDKTAMVEAVENMLADRLTAELKEFAEDRQGLIEARAQYHKKMRDDSKALESFVLQNLKKEIVELQNDRRAVAENVSKLESFIVDALAKEIAEFHNDKKDLAETKVKLIKESREKFNQLKTAFITKSAKVVEQTISNSLNKEMTQLKEDIEQARRNDFGRRIFESFASEYSASYLNEKSETAKLIKLVKQKDVELEEAAKIVAETQKILETKDAQLKVSKDLAHRKEIMGELLSPLARDKKEIMKELLESVQTDKLVNAFDKYLPAVMNDPGEKQKQALTESKVQTTTEPKAETKEAITGDKQAQQIGGEEKTAEIYDIRRLAGLKV
jgi:hypothetical protein